MPIDPYITKRLSVRDWRPVIEDERARVQLEAVLLAILNADVLAHLPPSLQLNEDKSDLPEWIEARAREGDVCLVETRDGGDLIGLLFLASASEAGDVPSVHIGYLLATSAWGQGIATELVAGLVDALKARAKVRLVGGVDTANPASARVLEKAGFKVDPNRAQDGVDFYVRIVA